MTENERSYTVKIPLYRRTGTKIKRLLAWLVDWNLAGLFVFILTGVIYFTLVPDGGEPDALAILLMMGAMLLYPVFFVLRDVVWGGRSLGKRIFGLVILDLYTGEKPKAALVLLRDIFVFVCNVDAILMLVCGRAIGDFAAHTVVLSKKDAADFHGEPKSSGQTNNVSDSALASVPTPHAEMTAEDKKKKDKDVFRAIGLLLIVGGIAVIFFVAVIFGSLQGVKKTESYQVAYTYLVNSEEFASSGISEDDLRLVGFEINNTLGGEGEAVFSFRAKGESFTVYCEQKAGVWFAYTITTSFHRGNDFESFIEVPI